MEYNPKKVDSVDKMASHLWDANCSVCSKIASCLLKLKDKVKQRDARILELEQQLRLRDQTGPDIRTVEEDHY